MAEKFFRLYFALFVSFSVNHSLPSFAAFATEFLYSSTTEISDLTPFRFNSAKNIW